MITDDNPFDDMNDVDAAPPRPPKESYEAPAPPRPPKNEPVENSYSSTTIDMAEYERRLADLEARERAVAERERQVAQEERQAEQKMQAANNAMASSKPAPNWPPCLPKKIVYMNFREEIPDELRPRVRMAYIHFIVTLVILLYNVICAAACMAVDATAIGDLILACVYVPFLGAMFFIVFRRLYKASKSGSSLSYFLFYIGFTIEIIIAIVATVGPPKGGLIGIIWTVQAFKAEDKQSVGFMCLVCSILWGANAGFMIYLWIHTRVSFKRAGGLKAVRKQAVEKATFGVVKAAKEHPDAAKKVGQAAVDYARENPDVVKDAASAAYGASGY